MNAEENIRLDKLRYEEREKARQDLAKYLNNIVDFTAFGFKIDYEDYQRHSPYLVVESKTCRVSFTLDIEQYPQYDILRVLYGRLHSPYNESVIEWNGQRCRCWHSYINAVFFLDGLSPEETVKKRRTDRKFPTVIQEFRETDFAQKLKKEYKPKFHISAHKALWEHYGDRLFSIFDLNRPDLWEQYDNFNREYHSIRGFTTTRIRKNYPREDEIC